MDQIDQAKDGKEKTLIEIFNEILVAPLNSTHLTDPGSDIW